MKKIQDKITYIFNRYIIFFKNSIIKKIKDTEIFIKIKIGFISFITLVVLWIFRADIIFGNFIIPGWSRPFTYSNYINDGTVAVFIALILFTKILDNT